MLAVFVLCFYFATGFRESLASTITKTCCEDKGIMYTHGTSRVANCFLSTCDCGTWKRVPNAENRCCEFKNVTYEDGASIQGICTDIFCRRGQWITNGNLYKDCGKCKVWGDPHIIPFNAVQYYDIQHECNYTAIQPMTLSALPATYDVEYAVYAKFKYCSTRRRFTCVDKTTFRDNPNTLIEFSTDMNSQQKIKVNGNLFTVDNTIKQVEADGQVHPVLAWLYNSDCIRVQGSHLLIQACGKVYRLFQVWAPKEYFNKIGGICGFYSGDGTEELIGRNGNNYTFSKIPDIDFSNSWLTNNQSDSQCQKPSQFVDSTVDCQNIDDLRRKCKAVILNSGLTQEKKSFQPNLDACLTDVCAMNSEDIEHWLHIVGNSTISKMSEDSSTIERSSSTGTTTTAAPDQQGSAFAPPDQGDNLVKVIRRRLKRETRTCPFKYEEECSTTTTLTAPTTKTTETTQIEPTTSVSYTSVPTTEPPDECDEDHTDECRCEDPETVKCKCCQRRCQPANIEMNQILNINM